MTQLRSVTCHMGSHSVTCHPLQVNTPRLNPSQTGRYSIYLPRRDGRLSWVDPGHRWLVTYRDDLPGATLFKKTFSSVVSNRIEIKFGNNVLQVNTHQLTESDFRYDVKFSRRRPWRHFRQQSAGTWWVLTQRLPGAYAGASVSYTLVLVLFVFSAL